MANSCYVNILTTFFSTVTATFLTLHVTEKYQRKFSFCSLILTIITKDIVLYSLAESIIILPVGIPSRKLLLRCTAGVLLALCGKS
jgi:hypothetical protein